MEEIVKKLMECGFNYKEAKLYYILCKLGPSKASDLANHLKLTRSEVYIILKKLQDKGFIEVTLERPMKFTAISFERVVEQIVKEENEKIEEMKIFLKRFSDLF